MDRELPRITILGVRHPDRRVPSIAPEFVGESVDGVFHESPVSESAPLYHLFWQILKHPLGVIIGTLRLFVYIMAQLSFLTKMLRRRKVPQIQWGGQAQGRKAAEDLAAELGTEVEYVDMNRIERLKRFPIKLSVMSWFGTVFVCMGIAAFVANHSVATLVISSILLSSIAVFGKQISDQFRPARDEFMYSNIRASIDQNGYEDVVIFTGENHVSGISTQATADSIETDCYWLSSLGELRDERK